jgi:putative transposase
MVRQRHEAGQAGKRAEVLCTSISMTDFAKARQYELRRRGYDLEKIGGRVAEIYSLTVKEVLARGRQRQKVSARSLFCYWAVYELGVTLTELARRLRLSPAGVGYAAQRGKAIARENGYRLM